MRSIHLFICLTVEALAYSQGFNRRYDAFNQGFAQDGYGIEVLNDGYMVLSGSADYDSVAPGVFQFQASVLLTRLDNQGVFLWQKRGRRSNHSAFVGWANCCDTIPGGGYVVAGGSEDSEGFDEVYLMRFDAQGDTLWARVFGDPAGNNFWIGSQVKRTPNGSFLVAGFTGPNSAATYRGFAIRTYADGNEQWRNTYSWPGDAYSALLCSDFAANGDMFMAGGRWQVINNGDRWVQRTDSLGVVEWRVSWGGPFSDGATQIATASDGHVLVFGGEAYATNSASMRPYLAKLDSTDGSIIWEHEYGPATYSTLFFAGKETPSGDLIAAGVSYANATTDQQGLLCRTTSEGDSIWMYNYFYQDEVMSDGTGRFYDVLPTADGGFIAAGATYFSASGNNPQGISQDTWVVKVDADGCIVPGCNTVGITEQATNLLDALRIWPNPAQGQCTVQLDLPASIGTGALLLTVVAADGRVAQQHSIAGNGTHPLDLQGLSAGLYHVHVSQGGRWLTGGKVVVE